MSPYEGDRLCYSLVHDDAPARGAELVRSVIGGNNLGAIDGGETPRLPTARGMDRGVDGCNCTGFAAQSIATERMPDPFRPVGAGSVLETGV